MFYSFEDFLRIRSCNPLRKYAKNVIGTVNPQIVVILENVPEIRKFHLRNFEVGVEIRKGQGRRKGINRRSRWHFENFVSFCAIRRRR